MISPLAYIHPEAQIGENVEIAPFVYIDKNVVIGDNNKIMSNASILYGARIGNGNTIFPGAVIGAVPQDLKFKGEETTAEVGDNNLIRENVTINRGTAAKGKTVVGSNNLLMEGVHVAHDAKIGNGCIIGNATKMAGEIVIDDYSIISASVLMHQFCRVGGYGMIQGGSAPTGLLQRDHRANPQRLPPHLPERAEHHRCPEEDRGRDGNDAGNQLHRDLHPRIGTRHHPWREMKT